jgi:hypothetical protein
MPGLTWSVITRFHRSGGDGDIHGFYPGSVQLELSGRTDSLSGTAKTGSHSRDKTKHHNDYLHFYFFRNNMRLIFPQNS